MEDARTGGDATTLSDALVRSIARAVRNGGAGSDPVEIRHTDAHSNEVASARFGDGRTLMVKRGRFEWAAERFRTSRRAAALMHGAGIAAPRPLDLPAGLDDRPLEVYWRIELPTLEDLWPDLDRPAREDALCSLGRLVRRIHRVRLSGFGPLARAQDEDGLSLRSHLEADLGERLLPAVYGEWEEGIPLVHLLIERLPELARRARGREPTLLHKDLHMGNVLCEVDASGVRCAGLLDLEASVAGLPESDLAMLQVMHGPLFCRPIAGPWFAHVRRGYDAPLEPWLLHFFRIYHLLNLGFYSALVGDDFHAADVAEEARRQAEGLGTGEVRAAATPA